MDRELRIFMGASTEGADNDLLGILYQTARKEGYIGVRHYLELQKLIGGKPKLNNVRVTIRGGAAGICVAYAAYNFLCRDVGLVVIDLENCAENVFDRGKDRDSINNRQMAVRAAIGPKFLRDPRLVYKKPRMIF